MTPWSGPALIAALLIGAHYLMLRAASGRIGDAVGALVLEASAAVGLVVVVALRLTPSVTATRAGVAWSCASGLCITGATTLLFTALRLGGPVASTGTIVLGGGVAISALAAPFLYGEGMTLRRALGVGLGIAAMAILATEPA